MGEGGIKGGAMGEGGIKGGAVDCPNTPEHTSRQQNSNSDVKGTSRGADNAQGRTKATTPMLHANIAKGSQCTMADETEGGGNTTRYDGG
jgi:hypothetical protein